MGADDAMVPSRYRVLARRSDTVDTVTLDLVPLDEPIAEPRPGQFTMLYAFGAGEVPISVSGLPADEGALRHTIRDVGATTAALCRARVGDELGVRGPFGHGWDAGGDDAEVVVVAGGLGLAPLRPVVRALAAGPAPERSWVLAGARTPSGLLYRDELAGVAATGVHVALTVDEAEPGWEGRVGFVTELVDEAGFDADRAVALVCGPEPMMHAAARALEARGVAPERIQVSLERGMHCALGHCGHCMVGPRFVCIDGPVLPWAEVAPLLEVRGR